MCTRTSHKVALFLVAGGREYGGADTLTEHHGSATDTSCSCMDEHLVIRLQVSFVMKGVVRGHKRQRDCRCFVEPQAGWFLANEAGVSGDMRPKCMVRETDDGVTDTKLHHIFPYAGDNSRTCQPEFAAPEVVLHDALG